MLPPIVKSFFFPQYVARIIKLYKIAQQFCHYIDKKKMGKSKPTIVVHGNSKGMEKNHLG